MTTIAFDGAVIASDRRMGGDRLVHKIHEVPDGWASGCGNGSLVHEVVAWLRAGSPRDSMPDLPDDYSDDSGRTEIMVVNKDATCCILTWPFLRPIPLLGGFMAIGSGAEYAMGAMACGAKADYAVEIASRFDGDTGGDVDVVCVRGVSRPTIAGTT